MQLSYFLLYCFNPYSLQSSGNAKIRVRDCNHDRPCDQKLQLGQELLISYVNVFYNRSL